MSKIKPAVQAYLGEDLHAWLQHDLRAAEDAANKDLSMSSHVAGILEAYARAKGYVPAAESGPSDPDSLKAGFKKLLEKDPDAARGALMAFLDSLGGGLKALACWA